MSSKKIAPQHKKFDGYQSLDLKNKLYQVKALKLLKALKLDKPKILELGCADGSYAALLASKVDGEAFGADIAPKSVAQALKLGVRAVVANLSTKFPFQSNKFDVVVALETIEHIFDTDLFLKECYRVLKPGGHLVLSTPNLASLQNRARLFVNKYPRYLSYQANEGHIFLYTLPILVGHLEQNKFQVVIATSPNFFNPWITNSWMPNFGRDLSMTLGDVWPDLGSHLLVVAKKRVT